MTRHLPHGSSSAELRRQQARRLLFEPLEARQVMAIDGLAIAGDSWSDDEYAGQNYNAAGNTSLALNWVDLLRTQRGVDIGPNGPFPPTEDNPFEHRAAGTAFNWASSVTTSIELLFQAQDIGIMDQVASGDVSHAVLMVGNIDLQPNSLTEIDVDEYKDLYAKIYTGEYDAADIEQFLYIPVTLNIEQAISTITSVGAKAILTTVPDPGVTPHARSEFPVASQRAAVSNAINTLNARIKQVGAKYHVPVVDLAKLSETLLGTSIAPATSLTIGGRIFDNAAGAARTNLFINTVGATTGPNLPHTVYQAHIANAIIEGLNVGYGENLAKFTEQQMVTLAGQSYGGANTFPVNYRSLVTLPPVTVFIDYGAPSTPNDDFMERVRELSQPLNFPQPTAAEFTALKANIVARLPSAFPGVTINFTSSQPIDTRYETIKLGKHSASVPGPLTSPLGQGDFDWLNADEASIGHVFPDKITFNLGSLPNRADQLRFLENILTYYVAQEAGRGLGLSSADAYGYSQVTNANYANTGGVQFEDYMSGDPALGFSQAVFNGAPIFRFSPLALAKLQLGHWLSSTPIAAVSEAAGAHATTATAQAVALTTTASNASLKVGLVKGATIATGGQKDWYKVTLAANHKLTAQTFATGVYGDSVPPALDTVIKIYAPNGTTLLYESDNTLLGNNSIGQTGTTKVDDDSLVLNYVAATAGDYIVEVTAKSGGTGSYDLLLGSTVANAFPWQNPNNPLNVNNSSGASPITAFDALIVINELNNPQYMNPATFDLPAPGPNGPPPYFDAHGNNKVTAFDALVIINYLNENPVGSGSEFIPAAGEAVDLTAAPESPWLIVPPAVTPVTSSSAGEDTSAAYSPLAATSAAELLLLNPYRGASASPDVESSGAEEADIALEELLAEAE